MSGLKVNLFGIRDGFIVVQVADSEEAFLKTTVRQLKKKIHEKVGEVDPENLSLLFAGKQLEDTSRQLLEDYNIQNGSCLQVVLRVHGGLDSMYMVPPPHKYRVSPPVELPLCKYRVKAPPMVHKEHNVRTNELALTFTTEEPDAILGESEPGDQPRVKMSCGHAVDPNSLTMWCRSLLEQEEYRLRCPAVVGDSKKCNKEWEYAEVRKVALLNDAERKYFETRLSEYVAQTYHDIQECPGCRSVVERYDLGNLRVHCQLCNYEFCWHCLEEWTGPDKSSIKCGNDKCEHPYLSSVRDSPRFTLNEEQVPLRRACPTCGKVIEHSKQGCKYMICPQCKNEYCFMCLELKAKCFESAPSSWFGKCAKPVAPIQTYIPVWSRPT